LAALFFTDIFLGDILDVKRKGSGETMFADQAKITVSSGKGGDGHVSFRRELYVAAGGPDGGDGGRGGDVIIEVDPRINTLYDFRHVRKYRAGDGEPGDKKRKHGSDGADVILKVPKGTIVREALSGKIIIDMSGENSRQILLKGGRGGKGNMHYATPTMQVPQYAQPGQEGHTLDIQLELKMIADVGLVGFPNAGKSTFLSHVSNAKPKIANYPFTTLQPMLGVVDMQGIDGFVLADIPGLIEGASEGAGLGDQFLRHIERTKFFIHMVDAASVDGRDPIEDVYVILHELENFDVELSKRPQVIVANKIDTLDPLGEETVITLLKEEFEPKGFRVFPVSAVSGKGIRELLFYVSQQLKKCGKMDIVYESEYQIDDTPVFEEPYTVSYDEEEKMYVVEGPRIERMLGYTNLDSEKGFAFFQQFLRKNGILDELEKLDIQEGDTVRMYGLQFDYYK
jgi:GTP-binding protein